jgi:catechol 2,3-dioxygenase-like lactoylglutathione lyase family enzyme
MVLVCCCLALIGGGPLQAGERAGTVMTDTTCPSLQANNVFFYYRDVEAAARFYQDVIGLERVADWGFAKMFRVSPTFLLTLVDEQHGMHRSTEPKSVTLSFVTQEIDAWFEYLTAAGAPMRGPIRDASRHPTRGFVAYDPEGYFLEFERFLDHPQNEKLLKALATVEPIRRPAGPPRSRPASLGVQANVLWLYYTDLDAAQKFYEEHYCLSLLVNQGFARVLSSSASGFIGLVDESQGLHRFAEHKAVTVSFLSEDIDRWFARFTERGLKMRSPIQSEGRVPVRTFVTYDLGGYYVEFDRFLEHESTKTLLSALKR